ncbi:MAG TPA: SDR family NAD(P)-dependent oxidoreductase, partial [Petrotogaceae bacterium]|nr:SDR family NAD(P)-dependent oxidoreductase [Petrotogaceae bacterium]
MKLQGMTAVVTGAGRGIGEKITELFIDNGATVAGIDLDEDGLQAQQQKYGEKFIPFICDITKSGDVDKTVKSIAEKTLKIDILVNNAGVTRDNLFVIMKEEEFDFVINVNLKGTFLMSKAVAKIMRKQKTGSIINISSVVGVEGNVGQANYAASKAGVGLTRTLARELTLKGEEIRV